MSGLLSMLSFKLMTIKMGEFKFFTIKRCSGADWVITLHCDVPRLPPPASPLPASQWLHGGTGAALSNWRREGI